MKLLFFTMLAMAGALASGSGADFEKINPEAERLFAEKSFSSAHEAYQAMDSANCPPKKAVGGISPRGHLVAQLGARTRPGRRQDRH